MADVTSEDFGLEVQSSSVERVVSTQPGPSSESLTEWRSWEQVENGTPSTRPPYWDTEDDDHCGSRPSDLFGKYTWKIDGFSQLNKKEQRSSMFEIGGYKWYILIYPQGCDVCNHLSLFLCVADHDKLLPGWSHFAQFTIAVVNKDPKKSKYSDTLHRFWKKEHDWGWKKFMELSKVSDGFLVDDALVIKAQVQVIREKTHCPFRCLDWEYRRELVRVYLSNVEQLCRRFVEEKQGKFSKILEDKVRWSSFHAFWVDVDRNARRQLSREKSETILKIVVKHFFIENEVTSTLVMDYLYGGLKVLEWQSMGTKGKAKPLEIEGMPAPFIHIERDLFVLTDDVLLLLQRAALEPLPPKDEKGSQNQNRTKDSSSTEEFSKDYIERDEVCLTELGRRTVEMFALNHIFCRIEVAYQEAIALKRQEELIREEEAAGHAENEQKSKRNAVEKEKRTKKKQAKQKKSSRKCKDRTRDEKHGAASQKSQIENTSGVVVKEVIENQPLSVPEKTRASTGVSDMSDVGDDVLETLPLELEEREASPISWDTNVSEIHLPAVAVDNDVQRDLAENKSLFVMDDSSSTCSTDSVPSVVVSEPSKADSSSNSKNSSWRSRGNNQSRRTSDPNDSCRDDTDKLQADSNTPDATCISEGVVGNHGQGTVFEPLTPSANDKRQLPDRHLVKEDAVSSTKKSSDSEQVDVDGDGPFRLVMTGRSSAHASPLRNLNANQQSKQTLEGRIVSAELVSNRGSSSSRCASEKLVPRISKSPSFPKQAKSTAETKISTGSNISMESRPSSAPLVPALKPATPLISTPPAVPLLSRSVSAAGRLGVDPSSTQSNVIQSYRNAIISGRSTVGASTTAFAPHLLSSSSQVPAYSRSSSSSASPPPAATSSASSHPLQPFMGKEKEEEKSSRRPGLTFGSVIPEALRSPHLWMEQPFQLETTSGDVNNHNRVYDDAAGPYFGGSSHRPFNQAPPAGSSLHHPVQGSGVAQDEFPHLDIINDLLDEEQSIGEMAADGYYPRPRRTPDERYAFADDPSTSNAGIMANGGDRYYEDQIRGIYHGCTRLDHVAGYANQWPFDIAGHHSVRGLGANGYAYQVPDYPNLACALNGYAMYRPANGH